MNVFSVSANIKVRTDIRWINLKFSPAEFERPVLKGDFVSSK